MTYPAGTTSDGSQRWVATPADYVTKAVIAHKDDPAFQKRFWDKVDVGFDIEDCHIWLGALSDEGYGNFTVKRHTVRAHRVAWILRFGDAPGDLMLDHVACIGRFCVNTDHLEPVDNQENTRRGRGTGKLIQREARRLELIRRAEIREAEERELW